MKVDKEWSQKDWDNALKKLFKLSNFEEILCKALEFNLIDSSDIIHASDIYKDPNKEYDDEEVKEIIKDRGCDDIMQLMQEEYSLNDILDTLPSDDILDNISKSDMLEALRDSWELDQYEEEIKQETYQEYIDEWMEEYQCERNQILKEILPESSDDWREFLCDHFFECSYYDNETFNDKFDKLKIEIDKSNYAQTY